MGGQTGDIRLIVGDKKNRIIWKATFRNASSNIIDEGVTPGQKHDRAAIHLISLSVK